MGAKFFTLIYSWANSMVNSSRYIFGSHHVLCYTINVYWRFIARRDLKKKLGRKIEYDVNYIVFIIVIPMFFFHFLISEFWEILTKN